MEELLTPAEMARADAAAIAGGIPGLVLMEAAGCAVARAAMRRFRPVRTLVLAGPGNNGGDGWVAARLLEQAGWPVAVAPLAMPRAGTDAATVAARWRGPVVPFAAAEVARAGLVIDAVFGAGLSKPVEGRVAEVLGAVTAPILAVDVPSGLDGATGAMRGFAPQAALCGPGEHLAVVVPVGLERRIDRAMDEAARREGLSRTQVVACYGRLVANPTGLEFQVERVERRNGT